MFCIEGQISTKKEESIFWLFLDVLDNVVPFLVCAPPPFLDCFDAESSYTKN